MYALSFAWHSSMRCLSLLGTYWAQTACFKGMPARCAHTMLPLAPMALYTILMVSLQHFGRCWSSHSQ